VEALEQKLYSLDFAMLVFNLRPETIRQYIREGKIEAVKVGKVWKIRNSKRGMDRQ